MKEKTLPELRDLERQGVTVHFPDGEKWTVRGARVRQLYRWYYSDVTTDAMLKARGGGDE